MTERNTVHCSRRGQSFLVDCIDRPSMYTVVIFFFFASRTDSFGTHSRSRLHEIIYVIIQLDSIARYSSSVRMTRGGAANGRSDVKTCSKRANWMWGDRDGNFDRGPVKSNLISQELLQDLPRGESRIQLLPDKDDGRIGVTMSVSSIPRARGSLQLGTTSCQCGTATKYPFQL